MHQLFLATDGAFNSESGRGGWAAVYVFKSRMWTVSGHLPKCHSSHYSELMAVHEGLRHLTLPCEIHLLTDAQRIVQEFESGQYEEADAKSSIRKAEKNLWIEVLKLSVPHALKVTWVKGHNGHRLNELANTLAQAAAALPFDEHGQSQQRRKVKKEEKEQAREEAQLQPVGNPLDEVTVGGNVTVTIRLTGEHWMIQVNSAAGVETLMGHDAEITPHARFFTALKDAIHLVPENSEVLVLYSGVANVVGAWNSKAPGKLHRVTLREAREVVRQRQIKLTLSEI